VWLARSVDAPTAAERRGSDERAPGRARDQPPTLGQVAPRHEPPVASERTTARSGDDGSARELGPSTTRASGPRRVADAIDPCAPVAAPELPDGFTTLMLHGVTIAWDPSVAIEATALAYATAGIVAEAAQATGTTPRAELTVVVYASAAKFRAATNAPKWADGLYDGAVHVPAEPREDFGVRVRTLHHEVMHAQLHAAIGCLPVWLNEGLAQYFANEWVRDIWMEMLRDGRAPAIVQVQQAVLDESATKPREVYALALAMILYVVDRGDDMKQLLADLRGQSARAGSRAAQELWGHRYPSATERDVMAQLARRLFGVAPGSELDAIFAGAVCCHGARLPELQCRGVARRSERVFVDGGEWCTTY
jgi:hypothetical protein